MRKRHKSNLYHDATIGLKTELNREIPRLVVIKELVESAALGHKDNLGNTILHLYCQSPKIDLEIIRLLIDEKYINEPNNNDITPFQYACGNPKATIEILKALIEKGAKVEPSKDKLGNTLLLFHCQSTAIDPEIIKLIATENTINEPDENGDTPLFYACANPKTTIEIVKTLIEKGANLNFKNGEDDCIAILCEPDENEINTPLLKYILEKGGSPESLRSFKNLFKEQDLALSLFILKNRPESLEYLKIYDDDDDVFATFVSKFQELDEEDQIKFWDKFDFKKEKTNYLISQKLFNKNLPFPIVKKDQQRIINTAFPNTQGTSIFQQSEEQLKDRLLNCMKELGWEINSDNLSPKRN